jgi:hypothetical protein
MTSLLGHLGISRNSENLQALFRFPHRAYPGNDLADGPRAVAGLGPFSSALTQAISTPKSLPLPAYKL